MATTELGLVHRIQRWDSDFLTEYVRGSRFKKFMGRAVAKDNQESGSEAVIQVRSDLEQQAGKTLNIPLITRLDGAGVQGYTRMTGNEEQLGIYNDQVTVHYNRNAVEIAEADEKWTEMDLRGAAKGRLRVWAAEMLRNDIIIALSDWQNRSWVSGRNADTAAGTRYTPTTFMAANIADTTNANLWQLANSDRILYANKPQIAGNNVTSIAQLVVSTDKASATVLMLAKGLAKTAGSASGGIHIRPSSWSDEEGTEDYVWFVPTTDFNNLAADTDIKAANQLVRERGLNNPIFQDGDLLYRGVIIREVPEIPPYGNVGASSTAVNMSFFCGAAAASVAWGQRPTSRSKKDDYDFFTGLAIQECRGTKKTWYNGKQYGLVTVFTTAA
jgi:N4-gp56 family major capsid protein